ncbi:amidohydrolase [uncultured Paracoccus sp.]|uniref:amidohydrolase n=1 Tax=uncultured Paracoccus sp. TaxID=189685 RepID=UPI00260F5649|nr:amidohydrolase [uncultured Paracoccus sp.]
MIRHPLRSALLGLGLALLALGPAAAETADLILRNGRIITMDPGQPRAEAVALAGERILAVGSDAQIAALAGDGVKTVDLEGKTVIPGLIDTHTHAIRGGQTFHDETYLFGITSLPGAFDQLRAAAAERGPEGWVVVGGSWHPNQFEEKRAPTVAELGEALPDHPIYLQYLYDYALVNPKGIELLGLDEPGADLGHGLRIERDADGKATGRLLGGIGSFNMLMGQLTAHDESQRTESLEDFFAALNAAGLTGVIDPSAGSPASYEPLFDLRDQGKLSLRVGYRIPAAVPGSEAEWFQNIMAFRPPHWDDGALAFLGLGENLVFGVNDGVQMGPGFDPSPEARAELVKVATYAAERRIPVEIHAYTDDAARVILDAFEEVAKTNPLDDLRWAIAHLNTGSARTLDRMKALGLAYSVQMGPYFEGPAILEANGPEVSALSPPVRLALDRGIRVAGGTDSTRIGVFGVWQAIEYHLTGTSLGGGVQRPDDQLLTRDEALAMYTRDAAWLAFAEADRGTITAGKLADLVVLDQPYETIPADQVHGIRSVLTLLGGKPVHDPSGLIGQ